MLLSILKKIQIPKDLKPKLFLLFKQGYSKNIFFDDFISGIIVGIVALPLAIAFAIASGVKPEQGLYTAIIAGLFVSIFSGSRVQISGPTGAFIVIIYSIVQRYGYDGLAIATILAGFLLVIMGFFKFGSLLKFIPYSLTIGFTSGIAIIIFTSQVKDFCGLSIVNLPIDFIEKWEIYFTSYTSINKYSIGIGLLSLIIIIIGQKFKFKIPGSIIAILVSTFVVQFFNLPIDTIGTKFGTVSNTIPTPEFPNLTWNLITKMFSPAFTIAVLAALESLLSAVVADGMLGTRHHSNMELIAQGIGNILSPIFKGIPITGAIARTATNIKNGGKTPMSGIIHGLVILLIMILFAKWASLIPMATLSAILIFVAYNMSEWRLFLKTLKGPKSDIAILLNTFFLTVLIDLTIAIEVGIVLSAMLFIKKMSDISQSSIITRDLIDKEQDVDEIDSKGRKVIPAGIEIFEIYGTLFFGAVDQFRSSLRELEKKPKVFILETKNLLAIDGSGLKAVEDMFNQFSKDGTKFIISGIHKQPLFAITNSGLIDRIGENNIFGDIDEAIEIAKSYL